MARYINTDELAKMLYKKVQTDLEMEQYKHAALTLSLIQYIEKQPTAIVAPKAEWNSVEDRLPDNDMERVLVLLKDDDYTKHIGRNKIDTDRFVCGEWVRWNKSVTHWMYPPESPKNIK